MTPTELRAARHALGLSAQGFAELVGVESGRSVRRWEAHDRHIPGPVAVLVKALLESRGVREYFGLSLSSDLRVPTPAAKRKKRRPTARPAS